MATGIASAAVAQAPRATPARSAHKGQWLPAVLSLIAGMVDVTGWATLGGLFTAHITGNLVVIAADLVRGGSPHLAQVLAVPVFVLAAAAADQIAHVLDDPGRTTRVLLLAQCGLLACVLALAGATSPSVRPRGAAADVVAMLAVSAMAVQNALLHVTRKSAPTTAVMTGNLVVCTIALLGMLRRDGDRAQDRQRWEATWPLLASFLGGCVLGAGGVRALGDWGWALPAAIALVTFLAGGWAR